MTLEDGMERPKLQYPVVEALSRQRAVLRTKPQRLQELNALTGSIAGYDSSPGIETQKLLGSKPERGSWLSPTHGAPKARKSEWRAWQKLIALNCILMSLVFICNTGFLLWSLRKPVGSFDSTRLLYQGDCGSTKSIDFWSHMAINVLSTTILAGGSYATQILVAPTREAIDKAHRMGYSLSVGIRAFRNWQFIGNWSKFLVLTLLATTFPIHAIYNSVVYSTISSNMVSAAVVTNDFLSTPQVNLTSSLLSWTSNDIYVQGSGFSYNHQDDRNTSQALYDLVRDEASRGKMTSFDNLTTSDCWNELSAKFVNDYSAVLYITNISSSTYNATVLGEGAATIGELTDYSLFENSASADWLFNVFNNQNEFSANCSLAYCLALKAEQPLCTVELVPTFLALVTASSLIKALVLFNLLHLSVDPLKTTGDAIASFMNYPDPVTENLGVMGPDIIRNSRRRSRYLSGASKISWVLVITLCVLYWIFGVVMAAITNDEKPVTNLRPATLSQQWKDGFGALEAQNSKDLGFRLSFFYSAFIVNLPQLWLSFIYVLYNTLLTDLLISREWLSYSSERKGLRVTNPEGEQRSAHFLSLPYRFSVPLIGFMAILHWMLSQSLYLGEINTYVLGASLQLQKLDDGRGITQYVLAWSSLGIMISVIIGGILIAAILILGFCKYKPGFLPAQINSRTISAACHSPEQHRDPTEGIQYGILADLGDGTYRVGFSSGPVLKIVDGDIVTA